MDKDAELLKAVGRTYHQNTVKLISEKDAKLYISEIGSIFREIAYIFTEYARDMAYEKIDIMTDEEIFEKVFLPFNISATASIKIVFHTAYQYASGDDQIDHNDIYLYLKFIDVYKKLFVIKHPEYQGRPDRINEDSILEKVSPSFAQTSSKLISRLSFENAIHALRIKNTTYAKVTVTPRILTDLSNISYPGVIKQIRENRLSATKIDGNWEIPILDALSWFQKRKDCPDWIKKIRTPL